MANGVHAIALSGKSKRSPEGHTPYDTAGRRIGSTDPDTDSSDPGKSAGERTWRYLFNRVGDLVAVRDPRGCGQNFYYDRGGRLVAEAYVECAEAQVAGDEPDETVPAGSVALEVVGSGIGADVVHYFDGQDPGWPGFPTRPTSWDQGRLVATSDRGQRTRVAYDRRGNVIWQARQMALLSDPAPISTSIPDDPLGGPPVVDEADEPARGTRQFDEQHAYVVEQGYDHGSRPTATLYPEDPDNPGFPVGGEVEYNRRGLVAVRRQVAGEAVEQVIEYL